MLSLIHFLIVCIIIIGFGMFVTSKISNQLTSLERWIVVLVIGIVVWMSLIYITSWLNIRPMSLVLIIIGSVWGWWNNGKAILRKFIKLDSILISLVIVGAVGQLFLVAPSGLSYSDGMRFYGVNSHDGMWHVALMQSQSTSFPPELPSYAGVSLKGYHYLIDLWGSELVRVFSIPAVDLTFRWFPLLFSILTGLGMFALLGRLTKSKLAQYLGVFLTYFAGSFGYILTLLGHQGHASEAAFWAQQSISTFINLPLGASFALIITTLLLLTIYFQSKQDMGLLWLSSLIVGVSTSVKAYGGLLMVGTFCVVLFLYGINKKQIRMLGPILLSLLLTSIYIFPQLRLGSQSFLYEPGWFLKTMMETTDHVNYPVWELQRQTYAEHNNVLRVAQYWIVAFLIFLIGNMGIRIIGFIPMVLLLIKRSYKVHYELIALFILVVGGIVIPMQFLQTGIVWNSIQFVYYSLFVMNIFTAMAIDQIHGKFRKSVVVTILIVLTMPTTFVTILGYYQMYSRNDSYFLIPSEETQALSFIKNLPISSKILTAYSNESYVPALTGKTVYYVDETQASILLLPTDRRLIETRIFCHTPDDGEVKSLMESNKLQYLYTTKSKNVDCHPNFDNNPFLTKVFENQLSVVYQLN